MISKQALGKTGLLVSRIGLGTTEIGYEYGIGKRPLPSFEEASILLNKAVELGITTIDTAHYYGEAEERIGKSGIVAFPNVVVITKCGHFLDRGEKLTLEEARKLMKEEVEMSMQKLGLSKLPLVFFHGGSAEQIKDGMLTTLARELKEGGQVENVGISTRGEEAPLAAIESGVFDALQVGYSIFDQRMSKNILPLAKERGLGIVNRSVFLKGVLTGVVKEFPKELQKLQEGLEVVKTIAEEYKMSVPTLALRFACSNPFIQTSLVGTNKLHHLTEMAEAAGAGPLPEEVVSKLEKLAISDPELVDPKRWPQEFHK